MTAPVVEAMLDDVLGLIATRRRRTPQEAPPHLTGGYGMLIIAVGFARVGLDARARDVWDQALTSFGDVRRDPVHAWLIDAYGMRITHAIARLSPRYAWNEDLVTRYSALEQMQVYKVNRLREASRSLDADLDAAFDAISMHASTRAWDIRASADLTVPQLEVALAGTPSPPTINALLQLDETSAIELIARQLPRATDLSAGTRAAMLTVAARFGFAEMAIPLLGDDASLVVVRALRRLGLHDTLATFSTSFPARAALGDPALRAEIPMLVSEIPRLLTGAGNARYRPLAAALSTSPSESVRDTMRLLHAYWAHASDSFGTNSHFTLSALSVIDSLVSAIVDHHLVSLSPRDVDPAVAWPYLL